MFFKRNRQTAVPEIAPSHGHKFTRAGLIETLTAEFEQIHAAVHDAHAAAAARLHLSPTDHRCLRLLQEGTTSPTPGELALRAGLSPGAITGVVDRLERAGFVRRERDTVDRRRVTLRGVHEGAARNPASPLAPAADVLARYNDRELAMVLEILRDVRGVLQGGGEQAARNGDPRRAPER